MSFQVPKEFQALELTATVGVPLVVVALCSTAAQAAVGSPRTVLAAVLAAGVTSAVVTTARLALKVGRPGRPYTNAFFAWSAVAATVLSAAACWFAF